MKLRTASNTPFLRIAGQLGCFSAAFFMLDRVLSGVVQCHALGCLPW